ncbi:hypothetical protein OH77DRAFT_1048071 [Trametes cingulata]|nr:hypothetical protein OH77DRAFT_1048071 [Trametes cingulata]
MLGPEDMHFLRRLLLHEALSAWASVAGVAAGGVYSSVPSLLSILCEHLIQCLRYSADAEGQVDSKRERTFPCEANRYVVFQRAIVTMRIWRPPDAKVPIALSRRGRKGNSPRCTVLCINTNQHPRATFQLSIGRKSDCRFTRMDVHRHTRRVSATLQFIV